MAWEARFFSLNKARDWQRGRMHNLIVTKHGFTLAMTTTYVLQKRLDVSGIFSEKVVRGTAVTASKMYFLTELSDVWMLDPFSGYTEPVFPLGQGLFSEKAELAAVADLLIVADPAAGVTAYSSFNRQPVWDFYMHQNVRIVPIAVATDNTRFTYVLGRTGVSGEDSVLVLVKIDDNGRVVCTAEIDGEDFVRQAMHSDVGVSVGHGRVLVWIKDERTPMLFSSETLLPLPQLEIRDGLPEVPWLDMFFGPTGELMALICNDEDEGTLLVSILADDTSTASGMFTSSATKFDVRASTGFTDGRDALILFDATTQSLSVLRYQVSYQQDSQSGEFEGFFLTRAFDSMETGMRWHKLVFDADLPGDCQVSIRYLASDSLLVPVLDELIAVDEVFPEDIVHRNGRRSALGLLFSDQVVTAPDTLIDATGRYLWLLVHVTGNRENSPLVRRVRIFYPRASYVDFLPVIYQEDKESKDFLERFLAIFHTISSNLDEQIDFVSHWFDARATPSEMLKWLNTWLGFNADETWSNEQLRDLIDALPELNRFRGTRVGIERIIQLYTGQMPMIVEYPQYGSLMAKEELRELMSRLYGSKPNSFAVLVSADVAPDARRRYVISKLIERQKPAFTEAKLVILSPFIYMDMHTYLGINTYLSEAKSLHLDGKSVLPHDTVIIDVGAWVTDFGTHD